MLLSPLVLYCHSYDLYEHSFESSIGPPHLVWGYIGEEGEAAQEGIEEVSIQEEASIEEAERGRERCSTRYQYRPAKAEETDYIDGVCRRVYFGKQY